MPYGKFYMYSYLSWFLFLGVISSQLATCCFGLYFIHICIFGMELTGKWNGMEYQMNYYASSDRADVLREEDPLLQSIGWSMSSVGQALGASDRRMAILNDGGGVEAATSSVLANYFLKSHGGAHALQCLCSSLATLSALGAIVLRIGYSVGSAAAATDDGGSNAKNVIAFTLLRRTMIFAMIKHVSGLLASASVAAKAIPKIGLTQARQWMEQIVIDPVSQYVFYTALLLLWLPPKQRLAVCWWWKHKWTIPILTGPILLREIISNILVISDILVLWSTADSNASSVIEPFLKISQSTINAVMSVVTTADVWRNADPATRQAILGKLVSRISLVLEVIVGILLLTDVVWGFVEMAFSPGGAGGRPSLRYTLTRFLCVRLYIHFLWIRRKKISQLALKIRGGASKVPFRVCDIVYDPIKAMGLDPKTFSVNYEKSDSWTWRDYLLVGLGLDQ